MDSLRAEIAAAVTSVGRLEAQASDASEERTKQRAGLKDVREAVAATIGSTSSFMSVLEEAVSRAEDKAERAMRAASGLEHGLPPPPKSLAIGDKSIRSPDGLSVDENTTPSPLVTAAAPKMPPSHSPSPESSVRSMASEARFTTPRQRVQPCVLAIRASRHRPRCARPRRQQWQVSAGHLARSSARCNANDSYKQLPRVTTFIFTSRPAN
eukprot:gnl/Ergobibamus_cyprinoides/4482.p1 GENE.gnl/Ergobibamus_cyprinoides/4482~~gnl/Ergobibamus_cyprinoides/4482.p1  ORF type:complete len:244 (+),score=17.91 gnl/Ergobibamus_cyprinoides/4482:102-734(+)